MPRRNRKRVRKAQQPKKPVLRLGGGRMRVEFGPGLGDPRVWRCAEGRRVIDAMRETAALERMWERSGG